MSLQVPKKMTCNEFIRNNRGINGGDNLPQEFLTSLYDNISRNEIKISTESANTAEVSPILWSELNLQSKAPRGQTLEVTSHGRTHSPMPYDGESRMSWTPPRPPSPPVSAVLPASVPSSYYAPPPLSGPVTQQDTSWLTHMLCTWRWT